MHILLIDDSSSTRSLLRTLINSGQAVRHEISEAASGEEALQKVGSGEINLPDLIIMDINMGGINGYELCREFRQRYGTTSDVVPYIIIVTANEGVDVINQALDSGANDYMPKPVNVKVLQVRLRVAGRLLAQAQAGAPGTAPTPIPGQAPAQAAPALTPPPTTPAQPDAVVTALTSGAVNPRDSQIGAAIEHADAPIAIVEAGEGNASFNIVYANAALSATTGVEHDQLIGKSLAELEAWTEDFLKMIVSYVHKGAILSYAPLWSRTRQAVPVHLSFYPVHSPDGSQKHCLVIHHF